ncbi:MAG: hypothetical protein IT273_04080 [Chitinophagales bacterium]|nr:hypothetical protein [Chitinophagales bacterium]
MYRAVEQITTKKYIGIAPLPKEAIGGDLISAKSENSQAVTISSISTTTITAGTFDTLTITGSGFTSDWLVAFRES